MRRYQAASGRKWWEVERSELEHAYCEEVWLRVRAREEGEAGARMLWGGIGCGQKQKQGW